MIYLGSLGRMVGIKCPASQNVQSEERYTPSVTLEGRRKMQVRPVGRRTWSLQTSDATTPAEHSLLSQFVNGAWGNGPFVFVSADAPHTNLLTPAAASCDPALITAPASISNGGPVEFEPGLWSGRSYFNTSPTLSVAFRGKVPVLPGVKVTGSAYVRGAGIRLYVSFWDSAGANLGAYASAGTGTASAWTRLLVTRTPPANAVHAEIYATGAGRSVAPALTWTDTVQSWSDGQGCEKAVVTGMSRDQVLAVVGHTYSNVSFTVQEVG